MARSLRKFIRLLKGGASPASPELAQREPVPYAAPLWLLAEPRSPKVLWDWRPPSLHEPLSQMCTSEQMDGEFYEQACAKAGVMAAPHRKTWEFIYVYRALEHYGALRSGARLLGFGVGQEPLPSAFAALGVEVMASDAPLEVVQAQGWQETNQHVSALDQMFQGGLVHREDFDRLVSYMPVDMNAIPAELTGFDGCWSACALEHLGSIDLGLDFIENSLATLKPGGIAVHTTELNLGSNEETFDQGNLCLFRRKDFERLIERLVDRGHWVAPLNLHPGSGEFDVHVDLPPYAMPHLKIEVLGHITTSFGLVVRKGGAA